MFYDRYVQLCEQKQVKPSRAAEEAGVSKSAVTNWKKNGAEPTGENVKKLCAYFCVTRSELFNEVSSKDTVDKIDLSNVDIGFLGDYKVLTEENKAVLRDMVRLMRERQGGEK